MAKKYKDRIETMDEASRKELDDQIREYCEKHGWQKALAKYKTSPLQLRAIVAGKDPTKVKIKRKPKSESDEVKAPKKKREKKVATKPKPAKKAKEAKAPKKAKPAKKAKEAKRKPGRPKGSGKKAPKMNGAVTKTNAKGDLIIEGKMDAAQFVDLVLSYSERMMKIAVSA